MQVRVDVAKCCRIADILKTVLVPDEQEEVEPTELSKEKLGNFLVLVVSVCHQTRDLCGVVSGKRARGWDYLYQTLLARTAIDKSVTDPAFWSSIGPENLSKWLSDENGTSVSMSFDRRAELIRDLGKGLMNPDNSLTAIYEKAKGHIDGLHGLRASLAKYEAYSDPVFKKGYFFLSLMKTNHLWSYPPGQLRAPVDYHEIRGHLRLGTVVLDDSLAERVKNRTPVNAQEDVSIRTAVAQAIDTISTRSGVEPSQIHYLFWNVFRSICLRDSPLCHDAGGSDLVDRYRHLLDVSGPTPCCPFGTVCRAAGSEELQLIEHYFETDWY